MSAQEIRDQALYEKSWSAALAASRKGDFASAERYLREVRRLRPEDSLAALRLAEVYDRSGRPTKALAAYREAFRPKKGPRMLGTAARPDVYVRFGSLLEGSGDRPKALDMYWNALAFPLPENPVGYKPRTDSFGGVKAAAHMRAGLELRETGRYEEALWAMKRAIETDDRAWRSHFHYGVLTFHTQRQEAMASLAKAERMASPAERQLMRDYLRKMDMTDDVTVSSYQPDGTLKNFRLTRAEYEERSERQKAVEKAAASGFPVR